MEPGNNGSAGPMHLRFALPERGAPDELEQLRALAAHLQRALASQPVIEQAKGILMATEGCTADEAFAMLRTTSQRLNIALRDVATRLVAQVEQRRLRDRSRAAQEASRALAKHAHELTAPHEAERRRFTGP